VLFTLLKDLRLIFRDRWFVFLSIVGPILIISIISAALLETGARPALSIAIVNEDGGPVAREFEKVLSDFATVVEVSRKDAVRFVVDLNRGPMAVVFPRNLSENYRHGRPTEITLLTDPAQEDAVHAAKTLLLLMEKRAQALADPFAQQMIRLQERNLTGNRLGITLFEQNLPGFCIMFVLVAVIFNASLGVHNEREWGTLPRLLAAPAGLHRILIGALGARFILGVLEMMILLVWSHFAFGVSLGSSPAALVVLTCAVVLPTVTTGLLVAAVSRTREQAQPLGLALVMVLSGLGGLWWPESMAPEWIRSVSRVAYTTWAMQGMNDLVLRDRGLPALTQPVVVLTGYGIATFALGLWLFRLRHSLR
jgi:ABC-2 type transport system permease protein